jgi:hypothetical protein
VNSDHALPNWPKVIGRYKDVYSLKRGDKDQIVIAEKLHVDDVKDDVGILVELILGHHEPAHFILIENKLYKVPVLAYLPFGGSKEPDNSYVLDENQPLTEPADIIELIVEASCVWLSGESSGRFTIENRTLLCE